MAIESAVPAPQPAPDGVNAANQQPGYNLPFLGGDIYNGNPAVGPGHVASAEDFLPVIKPNN